MSSTISPLSFPQPITFFLLAISTRVAFHAVDSCAALHTPLPSCSSSLSHDFLYFFKMTSYASLIKSNKTRQGDTLQMHRPGDVAAKQVKKINKTIKKRRRKKKTRLPRPVPQPNLWITYRQKPKRVFHSPIATYRKTLSSPHQRSLLPPISHPTAAAPRSRFIRTRHSSH
jgi:hypothetical protein